MKTKLETFLRKKKLWTEFEREFENYRGYSIKEWIEENGDEKGYFDCAFRWSRTKKGIDFWIIIDKEYEEYFKK